MSEIKAWDAVHGEKMPEPIQKFLDSVTDTYLILQLRSTEETRYERFSSMRELNRMGVQPQIEHYEVVYTAPLSPFENRSAMLEGLFQKFNLSRPADYTGHSLSVSDIIALKQGSEVSAHYVDSIGFKELPEFFEPKRPSVLERLAEKKCCVQEYYAPAPPREMERA